MRGRDVANWIQNSAESYAGRKLIRYSPIASSADSFVPEQFGVKIRRRDTVLYKTILFQNLDKTTHILCHAFSWGIEPPLESADDLRRRSAPLQLCPYGNSHGIQFAERTSCDFQHGSAFCIRHNTSCCGYLHIY